MKLPLLFSEKYLNRLDGDQTYRDSIKKEIGVVENVSSVWGAHDDGEATLDYYGRAVEYVVILDDGTYVINMFDNGIDYDTRVGGLELYKRTLVDIV